MGSLRNDRRSRRLSLAAGISLALAAGSALADAPKAANPSGLMNFPNVKVINAPTVTLPAQQSSSGQGSSQQGLRAYTDSSGKLRAQTLEEGRQVAAETKAKLSAKSAIGSRTRSATLSSEEAGSANQQFAGPENTVGLDVGEEQAVFQVVHKTSRGLESSEYTGKSAAEKAAQSKSVKTEVSHDR